MRHRTSSRGFSLIETMVAIAIGLVILAGVVTIFVAQRSVVNSATSQASIQDAWNAAASLVAGDLNDAGFMGCNTIASNDNVVVSSTASDPWVFSRGDFSAPVFGFDYTGTAGGGAYTISGGNPAADGSASDWSPALPASLAPLPEPGSDVLVVNGAIPGAHPLGVPVVAQQVDPNTFSVYDSASSAPSQSPIQWQTLQGFALGLQVSAMAISDCAKSSTFVPVMTLDASGDAAIVNPVTVAGTGGPGAGNTATSIEPVYQSGVQAIPVQQVAYYVGQGSGGEPGLFRAVMVEGTWQSAEIAPGISNMQILYGVGINGQNQGYLSAGQVQALAANPPPGISVLPYNPWLSVQDVRIALLAQGALGSAPVSATPSIWTLLGTAVTAPVDTRMRHVLTFDVQLRNSAFTQQ